MIFNMEYMETNQNGTAEKADEDERKLFVGGLGWQTSETELRTYFEKFGTLERVTLKKDNYTGESRGFGFVVFADLASVEAVLAEENHTINGKKIGPRKANPKPKPEPIVKVFIGGLDPEVPESDIRAHFEMFGTIVEIDLPFDKTKNQRRGFAFVKFESEDIVNTVIASNNSQGKQTLAGKEVDIKKHTPKTDEEYHAQYGRGRGGFGGRGRGRGGFGGGFGGGYMGYGGGYDDYGYGGYGYGGYGYPQEYYGYGGPAYGKSPRGQNRGRGRGFTPY